MKFIERIRSLNERLMLWQGWVPERKLHELDARAEKLIALYNGPAVTEDDVLRLTGHMNRIIERNVRIARRRDR